LPAFPRRPLELRKIPVGRQWAFAVMLTLFGIGLLTFDGLVAIPPILDDINGGKTWTTARAAALDEGSYCRSKLFITNCTLHLHYTTVSNMTYKTSVDYILGCFVDDNQPFVIRYSPANPAHFSLSWGVNHLTNRIISQVFAIAFGLLLIAGGVIVPLRGAALRRSLQAMAAEPKPVIATFVKAATGRGFANVTFTWTDPESGATRTNFTKFAGAGKPFWLDVEQKTMLALAGPDGRAHLLDETLGPVVLTDQERRTLAASLAG
ncbi:MAG TPA: hypothetical protein VKT70_01550, partial [Stellaceae bacterium]|nr:hypothetical protein [Stellaceae bacterium]